MYSTPRAAGDSTLLMARSLAICWILAGSGAWIAGCHKHHHNRFVPAGPTTPADDLPVDEPIPDDEEPVRFAVEPDAACAGEIIVISGFDFGAAPADHVVIFSDAAESRLFAGRVLEVRVTGKDHPELGTPMALDVLVPTGVRTGTVALFLSSPQGEVLAGASDFTACPVVVGTAIGSDGLGGTLITDGGAGYEPAVLHVYGYNLDGVTSATLRDDPGEEVVVAASEMTHTPPEDAEYALPEGFEILGIPVPAGLAQDCDAEFFTLDLETVSESEIALSGNDVQIPVRDGTDDALAIVDAAISGALAPAGVRAGVVRIEYQLFGAPAAHVWQVLPEYFDVGRDEFLPCTPATGGVASGLPSGALVQEGLAGALLGPGHPQVFLWDSAADVPSGAIGTRLRLVPSDPDPAASSECGTGAWESESIAIDNGAATESEIVESFDDDLFHDSDADLPGSRALWSDTPGVLGGVIPAESAPVWGGGTEDVELEDGRSYRFDTDTGSILDITDAGAPVEHAPEQPGAALDPAEFHLRSLRIRAGAEVEVVGANPLVIRCAGGSGAYTARIDGALDLSGRGAALASGGDASAGGGAGGDGGVVEVDASGAEVAASMNPSAGGGNGGGAGVNLTVVPATSGGALPRSGPGGGGGFAGRGDDGFLNVAAGTITSARGAGGTPRGDEPHTLPLAGSGGGGGGAMPFRPTSGGALQSTSGGGGGGGGGALELVVNGAVKISGSIMADGGRGALGSGGGAGPGGGGSGGAIAIRTTGDIDLGSESLLRALGGGGAIQSIAARGGNGSPGRIRLETDGTIRSAQLVELPGVDPAIGSGSVTVGEALDDIESGDGLDGALDLSGESGVFDVDTMAGTITGAGGEIVVESMSGDGEFEFTSVMIPEDATLRARGANPLIVRVTGDAEIAGVIDLGGSAGGQVDFSTPALPVPGSGGAPGAGGGRGGDGGFVDGVLLENGGDGAWPAVFEESLAAQGDGAPAVTQARGGASHDVPCPCRAGAGGGGGFGASGADGDGAEDASPNGAGGSAYGDNLFRDPLAPTEILFAGGAGGGGGGGSAGSPEPAIGNTPGTAGGGGGGFLLVAVGGDLRLGASALIRADGGDAYRAPVTGGSGGAGSGGGVYLQTAGVLDIGSDAKGNVPRITALGGIANLMPDIDANDTGTVDYSGDLFSAGGDGAVGRIRIESLRGIVVVEEEIPDCGDAIFPFDPEDASEIPMRGICPAASIGEFETADTHLASARSFPYPILFDRNVWALPVMAGVPEVVADLPAGTFVRVLYEGAAESTDLPGTPGPFTGLVADPSLLVDPAFIRFNFFLYSHPASGASPTVDSLRLPLER